MNIAYQAIWDAIDGNLKTFGTSRKIPPAVLREWRKMHKATHANDDKTLMN